MHLYKGRGKDPSAIASFRPIGLVETLLSLVADLVLLRCAHIVSEFAGPAQLGGTRDARCHIVAMRESSAARRARALPTCDAVGDACFGYDAGRHARVLVQAQRAGVRPREGLIIDAVFRRFRMVVRVSDRQGAASLLGPIEKGGGGMVQGLSCSGMLYCLLPQTLQCLLETTVPAACWEAHPAVLEAYHITATRDLSPGTPIDCDGVLRLAWRAESLLGTVVGGSLREGLVELMRQCNSDAERLMLMDLLDTSGPPGVALFIDDNRVRTSSPAAVVMAVGAIHSYARANGVVFEGGANGKSLVYTEGVSKQGQAALQEELTGTLQGDTPSVSSSLSFLGAAEAARGDHALAVLAQIECRSRMVITTVCRQAAQGSWPLVARKFYMDRATSTVAFWLPLVVEGANAALRLRGVQSRWAHTVLHGQWVGRRPQLPPHVLTALLVDLGWTRLWDEAITAAIVLRQRLALDPPCFAHARAACAPTPPAGGWVAKVKALQTRFGIPDFEAPCSTVRAETVRYQLASYRKNVVVPAVRRGLRHAVEPPLPWGSIAVTCTSAQSARAFEAWWHWRVTGRCVAAGGSCQGCGTTAEPTAEHLTANCPAVRERLGSEGAAQLFDRPANAGQLRARLGEVARVLLQHAPP